MNKIIELEKDEVVELKEEESKAVVGGNSRPSLSGVICCIVHEICGSKSNSA
jgi:hypothetical protein